MVYPVFKEDSTSDKAMHILVREILKKFCHKEPVRESEGSHRQRPNLRKGHDPRKCEACAAGRCPEGYFQKDRKKITGKKGSAAEWEEGSNAGYMIYIRWEWIE